MDAKIRNFREIKSQMFDDENVKTATSIEQVTTDNSILFSLRFCYFIFYLFNLCKSHHKTMIK